MALGKVQVDDGVLDIGVPQQQLNGTQIGAGLQQMCGIGVAEAVRADSFLNARSLNRPMSGMPHCFRGERSVAALAGKQIVSGLDASPVLAQRFEQLRA